MWRCLRDPTFVTDSQTHNYSIYRASKASSGKNDTSELHENFLYMLPVAVY